MNIFRNQYYLANRMTEPEKALEPAIAALGRRYRTQWLFMGLKTKSRCYIADFVLLDDKLVIEVDGDSHEKPVQKYKDLQNAVALEALGWHIYRTSNETARANPGETVKAALRDVRTTRGELEAALELHLRDFPELLAVPAKRTKTSPTARPEKSSSPRPKRKPRVPSPART